MMNENKKKTNKNLFRMKNSIFQSEEESLTAFTWQPND